MIYALIGHSAAASLAGVILFFVFVFVGLGIIGLFNLFADVGETGE